MSGSAGCNTHVGRYAIDGGAISFSRLVTTVKACEEAIMAQEQTYLKALQAVETISVFEGRVILTFDRGNDALRLILPT